jgi:hypothetical protein
MYQASQTELTLESGKMFCPCRKCKNTKFARTETVWNHLLNRGFTPHYYIWFHHGEGYGGGNDEASSSNYNNVGVNLAESSNLHDVGDKNEVHGVIEHDRMHEMVTSAFQETNTEPVVDETPNLDSKRFYDMLDAANQPIYEGCREGLSKLSLAARMMNIKTECNSSQSCMNMWTELFKEYLPEDNVCAESYYEIQKLVFSLGLPCETIDVCIDNCMIYWKDDDQLQECRFCKKPRYKPQGSGRKKVPYQRMWYLPITDRLKRLYQSEKTAAAMRWHAEHSQTNGEINHPSDAKAWKHFNMVHQKRVQNSFQKVEDEIFSQNLQGI